MLEEFAKPDSARVLALVSKQLFLHCVMFSFRLWKMFIVHLLCADLANCLLFLSLSLPREAMFLLLPVVNFSPLEPPDLQSI